MIAYERSSRKAAAYHVILNGAPKGRSEGSAINR
jgi:hypothetical protein